MRIDKPATIRLERQKPELSKEHQRARTLFNLGPYLVTVSVLNGRGVPTGKTECLASFLHEDDAKRCRDDINRQNSSFEAEVKKDDRESDQRVIDEPCHRAWEGSAPIQQGPWYVSAFFLDQFGRIAGAGIVSYFFDKASADACANTLNSENPAFKASVDPDPEFHEEE